MELIKETKSISPLSNREIDAQVIKEDNSVYLVKWDEEGKKYKSFLEKDYRFYKRMSEEEVKSQSNFYTLMLYISAKCNLSCPICVEDEPTFEPMLDEIETLLKNYKRKIIILCGREPTCREDLPQIIKLVNKRNAAVLLTNGIKLSNKQYLLSLKKAGLNRITFSLNGLNDEVYKKMNGKSLLDLKLQALDNIRETGIKTVISVTLARGINEDEIKKIYNFCLNNRSFVRELRIRTMSPVGRYLNVEPYCMSELIDLVSSSIGIDRSAILKEHTFFYEFFKIFNKLFRFDYFRPRLCTIRFHIKGTSKISSVGEELRFNEKNNLQFKRILLPYYLIRKFGILYNSEIIFEMFGLPLFLKDKKYLRINLRCWPNLFNIDLKENKKCTSGYYKDNMIYPVCYYSIVDANKRKSKMASHIF